MPAQAARSLLARKCQTKMPLARCLDECDFIDFFQRSQSAPDAINGGLAQELHTLLLRKPSDFGARPLFQNYFADGIGEVQQLMDHRPPPVAGAAALDAAGPFTKIEVAPFGGVEPAGPQRLIVIMNRVHAIFADCAHEPLGKNAVQRGNEVINLYAHVEEAPQHVDNVVGVDGGEDQMPGKGGVDRDLRGFLVTDFAHQDLVRIVTQNRAEAAREGQPLFLIYGNLRDAANLVLNRVLNGDDLVLIALDLIQRGVERGRLAGSGWTCHQHHPVRLADVAPKALQVTFVEADYVQRQLPELLAHRFLVEHAQHSVFAMHGGHDGNSKVDQPPLVAHAKTSVLGKPPLGDIQLAHNFDSGEDGQMMLARNGSHGRLQHAVNAVLHMERIVIGFDVDVRCPPLQRGKDGCVHQPDDWADVLFRGELFN